MPKVQTHRAFDSPRPKAGSASSISRRFINANAKKLHDLLHRRLDEYEAAQPGFVALVLDGKTFRPAQMIVALGVIPPRREEKIIPWPGRLGFIECASEHGRVCADFLNHLLERGLCCQRGLLVVIDGSADASWDKGLRKAMAEVFGGGAAVSRERDQWHKRENPGGAGVVAYLPKSQPAAGGLMRSRVAGTTGV